MQNWTAMNIARTVSYNLLKKLRYSFFLLTIYCVFLLNLLPSIYKYSFDFDETYVANQALVCKISEIVNFRHDYCFDRGNPPLFPILLKIFANTFNTTNQNMRIFPILISILTLIIIHKILNELKTQNIWKITILFIYSNSTLVLFASYYLRAYSLLMLICTVLLYFIISNKLSRLKLLTLTISLGFYTHYTFVIFLFSCLLTSLVTKNIYLFKKLIGASLLSVFFVIPLFAIIYNSTLYKPYEFWQLSALAPGLIDWVTLVFNKTYTHRPVIAICMVIYFLLTILSKEIKAKYLNTLLIVLLVICFVSPVKKYLSIEKYYSFILPILFIAMSTTLNNIKIKLLSTVIFLIFLIKLPIFMSNKDIYHLNEDWRGASRELEKYKNITTYFSPCFINNTILFYNKDTKMQCLDSVNVNSIPNVTYIYYNYFYNDKLDKQGYKINKSTKFDGVTIESLTK